MASKVTSTNGAHQSREATTKNNKDDSKISPKIVRTVITVFEQEVRSQAPVAVQSERDFYISKFVKEYGLLPDIAAAQYDQLHS